MRSESPHVSDLGNNLVLWFASPMARACFDPHEMWFWFNISSLNGGNLFETMTGDHTVVRIGGGGKDRWIVFARADVMKG